MVLTLLIELYHGRTQLILESLQKTCFVYGSYALLSVSWLIDSQKYNVLIIHLWSPEKFSRVPVLLVGAKDCFELNWVCILTKHQLNWLNLWSIYTYVLLSDPSIGWSLPLPSVECFQIHQKCSYLLSPNDRREKISGHQIQLTSHRNLYMYRYVGPSLSIIFFHVFNWLWV